MQSPSNFPFIARKPTLPPACSAPAAAPPEEDPVDVEGAAVVVAKCVPMAMFVAEAALAPLEDTVVAGRDVELGVELLVLRLPDEAGGGGGGDEETALLSDREIGPEALHINND